MSHCNSTAIASLGTDVAQCLYCSCVPHTLAKQLLVDTTHVQDYMYSSGCLHLMLLSSARGYIYLICTDREYINTLQWSMAEWLLANGTQDMLCVWCARVCARGHVREMWQPDVYVRPLVINDFIIKSAICTC